MDTVRFGKKLNEITLLHVEADESHRNILQIYLQSLGVTVRQFARWQDVPRTLKPDIIMTHYETKEKDSGADHAKKFLAQNGLTAPVLLHTAIPLSQARVVQKAYGYELIDKTSPLEDLQAKLEQMAKPL